MVTPLFLLNPDRLSRSNYMTFSVVAVSGGVTLANGSEEVTRLAVDPSQSSTIQWGGVRVRILVGVSRPFDGRFEFLPRNAA